KLHTPTFLTVSGTYHGLPVASVMRLQMLAGRLQKYVTRTLRGQRPVWKYSFKAHLDRERQVTLTADEIAAPSMSIGRILTCAWHLDARQVFHVPYPYVPSSELLQIPIDTRTNVVTFMGRLEVRKGVLDLAMAIPLVLREHPDAVFRFIGSTEHSHLRNIDMRSHLQTSLAGLGSSVEFIDHVDQTLLAEKLSETDICVFPSIWENFANVCLESMSAGRGVVASESGGMAEMLNGGEFGLTVPPRNHRRLAQAICQLLSHPEQRMALGRASRERILTEYSVDRIGLLQEESYRRAIAARKSRGARAV
ncbi:MAG: glycosyltransferase family 4 protein, partial [Granulosicoccus sp.]|nr:glycosyltransferase family 4 protein [Granulosicoccus sp.]